MATLILAADIARPDRYTSLTKTEVQMIIALAGLVMVFIAAIFIQSRSRPRYMRGRAGKELR